MDYSEYYSRTIRTLAWPADLRDHPLVVRAVKLLQRFARANDTEPPTFVEIPSVDDLPPELKTGDTLVVQKPRHRVFGRCPGTHGHLCCNYLTVDLYVGCTLGCTYCIMQSYLRQATVAVHLDTDDAIEQIRAVARSQPDRLVRVGTGEVGDSLLYDPLFDLSRAYIHRLSDLPNVRFELKTKTAYVDHLLDIVDKGRAIIAFSLNPGSVVEAEEGYAARLDERLEAARKAADAGYGVAFHFDPMIRVRDWKDRYRDVVLQLAEFRDADVGWISLGTLRYPPNLRSHMEGRPYLYDEFVRSQDGKYRYLQPLRAEMYRFVRRELLRVLPQVPIYMCMESPAMWRHVMDSPSSPDQARALRDIMRPVRLEVPT